MSFLDNVKNKIKQVADSVTGNAATVALETSGKFAAGEIITAKVTITSTGNAVSSKGVFVDLLGQDDDNENLVEKAREFVTRDTDPVHEIAVGEGFELAAGETKVVSGQFTVPADLDAKRVWYVRGRVQTFGNDPNSDYVKISE